MTDSKAAWAWVVAAWATTAAWVEAAEVTILTRVVEWVAEVEWEVAWAWAVAVAWAVEVAWGVVDRRDTTTTTTVAKAVACRCVCSHTFIIALNHQYNVSIVACTAISGPLVTAPFLPVVTTTMMPF